MYVKPEKMVFLMKNLKNLVSKMFVGECKKFKLDKDFCLADRPKVTMTSPFMRAYALLLLKTCHKRGAPAIGGMAALIPIKNDAAKNEVAMGGVRNDKARDATDGYDGGWVAHPGLVDLAMGEFKKVLGDKPNQIDKQRPDINVTAAELLDERLAQFDLARLGAALKAALEAQAKLFKDYGQANTNIANEALDAAKTLSVDPRSRAKKYLDAGVVGGTRPGALDWVVIDAAPAAQLKVGDRSYPAPTPEWRMTAFG